MRKRLIETAIYLGLIVGLTSLVLVVTGCPPEVTTPDDPDVQIGAPTPQVDDTAQRTDTVDDRSWVTWEECSQKPGDHPCNFELRDQHGDMIELYDFHDKVIVVDLSSIWCVVCQNIAQKGEELTADYGEDNFAWITILIDGPTYGVPPTLTEILTWVTNYNITGPVLAGDRTLVDLNAETGYPVTGWPTLVVIDQNMVLQHGINGWNEATIRGWVQNLL